MVSFTPIAESGDPHPDEEVRVGEREPPREPTYAEDAHDVEELEADPPDRDGSEKACKSRQTGFDLNAGDSDDHGEDGLAEDDDGQEAEPFREVAWIDRADRARRQPTRGDEASTARASAQSQ